ncbi:restriction endonuclease subunit S [Chryseobacterium sp.]|uniref:restriction endonuclease subunit S n=1 Tax=Chryseobacterium sp. TaxID=1871047 RepID=UPI00289B04BD|nr:restriction endonuclease subunit S [Chryseobacterium sp.]
MTEENKSVKNFPNLRFPGFGGDWEETTLGNSSHSFEYGMNASAIKFDGENRYIRITDIDESSSKYKPEFPVSPNGQLIDKYLVGENDILFARTGASTGKSYLYDKEDGKLYFAGFLIRAKIKEKFNSYFVFTQTKTIKYYKWVQLMSMRSGQPGINSQEYASYSFNIPSRNEQDKIASFLLVVDERIQTQKKIIEKLETLMKACREKLFSQKLRFKDKHESDFPAWERKKIKEILEIGSGKDYKHLNNGLIPVYGTGGIITFVDSFLYDGETVCIGRKGTIDKPIYYNGKIWTVDTLFYTHSFNNSVPKFVFNIFQNINWKEYNEASGVPSLSKNTIEKIEISIPCLEEQYKITNFLSSIQNKIETEKQILEKLELQKKFLLANLFV